MLLVCLLIFFLPFIAADDFEEIIHRKFPAMDHAKERLEEIVKIGKNGRVTYHRAMFVHCNKTEYLHNFTFLANYDYLENMQIISAEYVQQVTWYYYVWNLKESYTSTLDIEVRVNNYSLSFQLWAFREPYQDVAWELHRVEDLTCNLPKKSNIQEAIEMAQYFYFSKGEWEQYMLSWMFTRNSWFKFCDGSVEKYFFHKNDILSQDPVIIYNEVKFIRKTERSNKYTFLFTERWETVREQIPYIQVDVTVNGRRMQLEYDDDWEMFTKGREYPCAGDEVSNWN